ncbi:MAG: exodeoxyribonuclease III [Burkholderiales bacterium]|nr:MAG: exodeoxyribonuclease III [Betaproteobacteria bacterium]TAG84533.1 MAG: exodeoxyribonuclease III [Burkholderiales bacterium]
MKITTWNVNSLTARKERAENWLRANAVDVLCLQELKMEDAKFPHEMFNALGYHALSFGQKTYNGVAIITKNDLPAPTDIVRGIPGFEDEQSRAIAATVGDTRVICLYVVNGQEVGSEKFAYKLRWLEACTQWLERERATHEKLVVVGDFNIAPTDADVHDPKAWEGQVLCTVEERAFFNRWVALGLSDTFRQFEQPANTFSWWDYRMLAFPKNKGLRIDHVLASPALASRCTSCAVDRNERKGEKPSDHAPVTAVFAPE